MPEWKVTRTRNVGVLKVFLTCINAGMVLVAGLMIYHVCKYAGVLSGAYICYMFLLATLLTICGLLGIIAILRGNLRLSKAYGIMMIVVLLAQVLDIFVAKTFYASIRQISQNNVEEKWNEEFKHPGAMDELQSKFVCCGNDSFNDYITDLHRSDVPSSCYGTLNSTESTFFGLGGTGNVNTTLYEEGCFTGAEKTIFKSYALSLRPHWGTVVVAFILLVWVLILLMHLNSKKRRSDFES